MLRNSLSTSSRAFVTGLLSTAAIVATAPTANAVLINPYFDPSITSVSNAADIENAIAFAASTLGSMYTDEGDVNIVFRLSTSDQFLATSYTASYGYYYSDFTANLLANDAALHPENVALNTAIAHFGDGNQLPYVAAVSANGRIALGDTTAIPCFDASGDFVTSAGLCTGSFDGVVTLSSNFPLSYVRPIPAYDGTNLQVDAISVIEHEIDEILGVGGANTTLNDPFLMSFGFMGPQDLYRYMAPGVPSFTTSSDAAAYFSIDGGVTRIVDFNQSGFGDYADWAQACVSLVQSSQGCANQEANVYFGSPEDIGLQAVGWDPVPEPPSSTLFGIGLLSLLGLRLTRRRA